MLFNIKNLFNAKNSFSDELKQAFIAEGIQEEIVFNVLLNSKGKEFHLDTLKDESEYGCSFIEKLTFEFVLERKRKRNNWGNILCECNYVRKRTIKGKTPQINRILKSVRKY